MIIHIVNPLGVALAHYSAELQSVLNAAGVPTEITSQVEPSLSRHSRLHWAVTHFASIRRAAAGCREKDLVISTWPVLGYFDLALNRLVGRKRAWLVVHDPDPLVSSVGHGRLGRLVLRFSKLNRIICHSSRAIQTVFEQGGKGRCVLLPHPIANSRREKHARDRRILVIGQYKVDRDLELIRFIGKHLHKEADLQIAGRGWPELKYWNVRDRFLSEQEFRDNIATAGIVLIPYRRFFQSGVAIRCVEQGVPFVGPKGSSLDELVGSDSIMVQEIDDEEAWVSAIRKILSAGATEMTLTKDRYMNRCHANWFKWLGTAQDQASP
jgi:hypothetical protein